MNTKFEKIIHYFQQYINSKINIEGLQQNINSEILKFDNVEERKLYNELLKLEGSIDSIRFSISDDMQMDEIMKLFDNFKKRII
jgi:hypothetical protein